MDWTENGMYRFGLIENCHLPSNKDECALFEGAFCLLKELEVCISYSCPIIIIVKYSIHLVSCRGN